MDVLAAISKAEADLASTREQIHEYREVLAALEQDNRRIAQELSGLRSFATRSGLIEEQESFPADGSVVPINGDVRPFPQKRLQLDTLSRSDAVVAIMANAEEPVDRNTINERLADAGRYESLDDISLALSGLKRSNRVIKLGRGLWELSPQELELASADG